MVFWVLLGILVVILVGIAFVGIKDQDWDALPIFFGVAGVGAIVLFIASIILMVLGSTIGYEREFSHTERYKIVENSPIETDSELEVFVYDANGTISELDVYAEKITISGKNHVIIDHYIDTAEWAVPWQFSTYTEVKIID